MNLSQPSIKEKSGLRTPTNCNKGQFFPTNEVNLKEESSRKPFNEDSSYLNVKAHSKLSMPKRVSQITKPNDVVKKPNEKVGLEVKSVNDAKKSSDGKLFKYAPQIFSLFSLSNFFFNM